MKKQLFYYFIISLFALISCKQAHYYNEYKSVDIKKWKSTDTLTYNVDIEDSISIYNIYLSVRHQKDYEFSNLWLNIITLHDHVSKSFRIEVPLFKNDGKPYGESSGSLCTQTIPFQQQIHFSRKGTFLIKAVQLMRKDPLDGISDIGVIIDKK